MKPFLILQIRPNTDASDNELEAILNYSGLKEGEYQRIRLEQNGIQHKIDLSKYSGIIVGGGPSNVSDKKETKSEIQTKFEADLFKLLDKVIAQDFPYLGACYGLGILAKHQGVSVSKEKYFEPLSAPVITLSEEGKKDKFAQNLTEEFRGFVGHKEAVQTVPENATLLASSQACPVQLIRIKENIYATQFHPELDAKGLAFRIGIYKHAGYFPPEEAQNLIDATKDITVTEPGKLLKQFVEFYKQD